MRKDIYLIPNDSINPKNWRHFSKVAHIEEEKSSQNMFSVKNC